MANKSVKNSTTGTMGVDAAKRSRFEKSEIAYGKIPAAAYVSGDTLQFTQIPAKEIIHGRIVNSEGDALEIFNKTDFSSAIAFAYDSNTAANVLDLHYVITYIRGTGKPHPGLANGVGEVDGEQGQFLQVTVTVS